MPVVPVASSKPPSEPPINGGQRWSIKAVNGGQRRLTVGDHHEPLRDHRQTTRQPPVNDGGNSSLAG
ncbi:hypothetical protein Tco_0584796, partial [Tanacetum coccineum]